MEDLAKGSTIINFYLLYKLLLEISNHCEEKIVEELSIGIFRNIEHSYCQDFANYILEKHEILNLKFDPKSEKAQGEEPLIDIMERIKRSDSLKWREAIREDGVTAIMVEFEEEGQGKGENYLIKMEKNGKIKVSNCNTIRMKWQVTETAEKKYNPSYSARTSSTSSATKTSSPKDCEAPPSR